MINSENGRQGRIGLILAGGAARGAYEVGVVQYILEEVARSLGRDVPLDILCGTSVGALNACVLAAFADEPRARAARLAEHWTSLRIQDLLRPDGGEVLGLLRGLLGRLPVRMATPRRGGIFKPAGLENLLHTAIPWRRIDEHVAQGRLLGLSVSTTHVATGHTVVFVQRHGGMPRWGHDPTLTARAARIRMQHALASAAIPILFPAVHIDGDLYCDGGLRQNVPLSPARRMGADSLIVINPHYIGPSPLGGVSLRAHEQAFTNPLFLIGKALNALLLDRIDNDIERLRRINGILEAGCRRYGPDFLRAINEELGGDAGRAVRILRAVVVRSSRDIGVMSAEYVRSPGFAGRAPGVLGRLMRHLAEYVPGDADFLSYLLFDGEFARQLIELGRADARARHEELCALIEETLAGRVGCR
jgi:NTE family protein